MKKIIAVGGVANAGKTTTLKLVKEELLLRPGAVVVKDFVNKSDIKIIIRIGGLLIGIESNGDPTSRVREEELKSFIEAGCDVIICATRTSGNTYNVPNLYRDRYEVVRVDKPRVDESAHRKANADVAKEIIELIFKDRIV